MSKRAFSVLATAAVAGLFLSSGCSYREAICSSGEYPVKAVNSTTGAACVTNGEEPPDGYVRFPKGKVPKHVDDEWDKYWNEHTLDDKGNEVAA
ncbi:SCO0607 family lipoprotein [Micromonosporaceae bacterium Da 78-11]